MNAPFEIYDPKNSYFSLWLDQREILKLNPGGTVEIADGISDDEAATAFWNAVKAQAAQFSLVLRC